MSFDVHKYYAQTLSNKNLLEQVFDIAAGNGYDKEGRLLYDALKEELEERLSDWIEK